MRRRRRLVVLMTLFGVVACTGPVAAPTESPSPTGGQPTPTVATAPTSTATATATATATMPEPSPSTAPTGSLGAQPTPTSTFALTVRSADGVVTVEVPAGALPPGTTVSIEKRGADQAPAELVTAGLTRGCYALLPEGTQFIAPVKVTYTVPRSHYGDAHNLPLLALATRTAEGAWEWLGDAAVWLTDTTTSVAGYTSRFSCLYEWSDRTDLIIDPGAPRTDRVGQTFARTIEARSKDARVHEINFTDVSFYNYTPDVIAVGPDTTGTPSAPKAIIRRDWTCLADGPYQVEFWATINSFAADNPFWHNTLNLDANSGSLRINLAGDCTDDEGIVDQACIRVHHTALDSFVSYLEFLLWFAAGYDVDLVEVTLLGANDDQPARLERVNAHVAGELGLHNAGPKTLQRVLLHTTDGQVIDVTEEVRQNLGDIVVEFPAENTIGECP